MFNKSFVGRTSDRIGANKFVAQMNIIPTTKIRLSQQYNTFVLHMGCCRSLFRFEKNKSHDKHFLNNN